MVLTHRMRRRTLGMALHTLRLANEKANIRRFSKYAHLVDDRPRTKDEIDQLRRNLARLSEPSVENVYGEAHKACELKGNNLPKPVAIQQLVQAWRQLWTCRGR
jgi:hypothetical protein